MKNLKQTPIRVDGFTAEILFNSFDEWVMAMEAGNNITGDRVDTVELSSELYEELKREFIQDPKYFIDNELARDIIYLHGYRFKKNEELKTYYVIYEKY